MVLLTLTIIDSLKQLTVDAVNVHLVVQEVESREARDGLAVGVLLGLLKEPLRLHVILPMMLIVVHPQLPLERRIVPLAILDGHADGRHEVVVVVAGTTEVYTVLVQERYNYELSRLHHGQVCRQIADAARVQRNLAVLRGDSDAVRQVEHVGVDVKDQSLVDLAARGALIGLLDAFQVVVADLDDIVSLVDVAIEHGKLS